MYLKGFLTFKKKYFNLNVSFYQGKVLHSEALRLHQLNIKCGEQTAHEQMPYVPM